MTHHEINEAIARSLGWRQTDYQLPPGGPRWWEIPGVAPDADRSMPGLPDFAASQDALDRWVQPEVEMRGWSTYILATPGPRWECVLMEGDMPLSRQSAPTAAMARCLSYLEVRGRG